ncbi:ferredoxin--NADP+ reductase [Anaeroplasma bactoclasticum]|jgi:ferredoxin--NADP+ reductase|uniref:Ferredoxin--NADP+ reductase n=1 Tax=Anaeroplasma bactoclasticum TaxID=2088 RepID=A0A397R092_9MOLU|nr:sulfide/dihydroorotate dehydrogenase-like FAD/NAD-binding protein [Anaeroplasma bactoclasticum]RIA64857.1 ferredoxin--NADP+ reductase [Anaeroplasma bactoclasticum]
MYKIVRKEKLNPSIYLMDILAPLVAKSALPGQFIIVRNTEFGERIPLTVADTNPEAGTVTIVFQPVGASTLELAQFEEGEEVASFVGPLGRPSDLVTDDKEEVAKKKVVFIAGGVGTAPVYPQVKWMHEHGFDCDVIIGARNKDLIIMEDMMRAVAKNLYVCTDDGSYGFKGNVTQLLADLIENQHKEYNHAVVIGPMIMMKFACLATKKYDIPTIVSLNPIMVDGTGMCGACRVVVDGKVKFACVDGPEFDGHLVDFDQAMRRQAIYKTEEGRRKLAFQEGRTHHGGCGNCKEDK